MQSRPNHQSVPLLGTLLLLLLSCSLLHAQEKKSLVERLGYPKDARLLIINADDFGMCHSANMGTFKGFESGGLTSATLMTVCPWFPEAALWIEKNPQYGVGVHTVLTSEWKLYKWGPILGEGVPSLRTKMGYFPADLPELYAQGKAADVEKELRTQIRRAYQAKIDVTHIDAHMGGAQMHPEFLKVYAKLAKEYDLPCRMPSRETLDKDFGAGAMRDIFDELGVVCCDELYRDSAPSTAETEAFWKKRLSNLRAGWVSEIYIHAADDSPEMKVFTGSQGTRYAETEFFSDPKTIQWIKDQGIITISYKPLRDLQRAENAGRK
ncbi:MAG: polysaccharide deacetylase family protein [Thermoguttaceae bacterium]